MSTAFDQAHAAFIAAKAIENATSAGGESDAEMDAFYAVIDNTDEAFEAMMALPVTDGPRAAMKLEAAMVQFDMLSGGISVKAGEQMFAEVLAALRGTSVPMSRLLLYLVRRATSPRICVRERRP